MVLLEQKDLQVSLDQRDCKDQLVLREILVIEGQGYRYCCPIVCLCLSCQFLYAPVWYLSSHLYVYQSSCLLFTCPTAPVISSLLFLSLAFQQGEQGPPGSIGATGEPGPQGAGGPPGGVGATGSKGAKVTRAYLHYSSWMVCDICNRENPARMDQLVVRDLQDQL